jgi:hypothetical protein
MDNKLINWKLEKFGHYYFSQIPSHIFQMLIDKHEDFSFYKRLFRSKLVSNLEVWRFFIFLTGVGLLVPTDEEIAEVICEI